MADIFDFSALERLKNYLATIRRNHVTTMAHYVSVPKTGFWHQPQKRNKSSLSSTATCVSSLVGSNLWHDLAALRGRAAEIAAVLISKRKSAGLKLDNPFSLCFVVEGVLDLLAVEPGYNNWVEHRRKIDEEIAPKLMNHLRQKGSKMKGKLGILGASSISPYPPSAYLTQLVVRVLDRCNVDVSAIRGPVHSWARSEINKQSALITAKSRNSDPLQLAYALILAVTTVPEEKTSPEDKEIFRHALALFFAAQNDDGSWPLSRPLFHYPEVGNAYCFDYELLTQLLSCRQLWDDLLNYILKLEKSANLLTKTAFDLNPDKPGTVIGWASGHHPQLEGPESWSTASVYHFAYALDRLVAEGIRRAAFDEVRVVYQFPPSQATPPPADGSTTDFAPKFLDAELKLRNEAKPASLRETLARRFVYPIALQADRVRRGGQLADETPMSAIFFGPPGTSKTELARIISEYLNWPLLSVDPSYLVQQGLDKVQAMANRLFSMLVMAEQIVVLLDEFDELGRNRAKNEDLLSRFITTAMLPKLAAINKERKIVFLLATNCVSGFDAAFRRGGRFDMLLQVMQPTLNAKLNANGEKFPRWAEVLGRSLGALKNEALTTAKQRIADLTYLETKHLVRDLTDITDPERISAIIKTAWDGCTLEKENDIAVRSASEGDVTIDAKSSAKSATKWRATCAAEADEIRIPPFRASA